MSVIKSPTMILGTAPPYAIDQSIRFNSADSPYMQRTYGAGGNVDKWTVSFWIKRSTLGSIQMLFASGANISNAGDMFFTSSDTLEFRQYIGAYQTRLITTQVFRDPLAWYHIVCVYDSGNAVSSERARIYINGARVTDFGTETYPSQNQDGIIGSNVNIGFGWYVAYQSGSHFDGYLAEMHYVNGSTLDPSSFGEYNSSNIWIAKEYSGSYGTGGFYIKGEDSSDLGNDSSGNNNDFTTSGLAAHDQVLDSPTNNFAVMNPVDADGLGSNELTGGNLQVKNINRIRSSIPFPTSGKWYWEICTVSNGGQVNWNYGMVYFKDQAEPLLTNVDFIRLNWYHGSNFSSSSNWTDGDFWTNSNNPSAGDIYGFAWDSNTKKVWLAKNNTYFGSGNPAGNSGTPWGSGGTAGVEYGIAMYSTQNFIHTINFGQDDSFNGAKTSGSASASDDNGNGRFFYAPPTGFLSLCTKNLGAE